MQFPKKVKINGPLAPAGAAHMALSRFDTHAG